MDPLPHSLVQMKQTSKNVFLHVAKKCGSHKGKDLGYTEDAEVFPSQISEAYPSPDWQLCGWALSCKRMIPSDSIPGRFDFMARRSTLIHQETNHTSLLFFACLHFQCWTNTLYTAFTSRAIKTQLCGAVRFHYVCLLPYRWQTTVLPAFVRNVFYGGCSVFI